MSQPNAAQAERWNGHSGRYWIANRERHAKGHQRLVPHLLRAAAIVPGDLVLDVGCGCGGSTIAAARAAARSAPDASGAAGPSGSAFGLDLSRPMLAEAGRLAAQAGLANVTFEQGDAQVFPLPRDHFDVMISCFGIMFFDDPAAAFANIVGSLRDRGRLAFLCWQDDTCNEFFSIQRRAFQARMPQADPSAASLFSDPDWVTRLLSGTGCTDIRLSALIEPAWMGTDVADVMSYQRDSYMVRNLTAELGDQALAEQALAEIAEQYAARQRPDGVWVTAAAWLVTARRG